MCDGSQLSPSELEPLLDWAGAKLIALPGHRIGPADYRVFWPDYDRGPFVGSEFRQALALRRVAPSGQELDLMDELLTFPNLIERAERRRVVRLRSLIHPISSRRLWPWTRIARELSVRDYTAKHFHRSGLEEICRRLPSEKVCSLRRLDLNNSFSL
jgi:hypothetical protein